MKRGTMDVKSLSDFRTSRRAETETEGELRRKLAAAYRIFDYFGWTTLIFGHITIRLPGPEPTFLINPFGLRFDEVTASNLVKIDLHGNILGEKTHPVNPAGFFIHSAIHGGKADAHCVAHIHSVASGAIAATKDGLRPLDFSGCGLYGKVSYHDFGGVHRDERERESLVQSLGDNYALILRNHGLLTCGPTIASAFRRMYSLENACRVQAAAMALNVPLQEIPHHIAVEHAAVIEGGEDGELSFAAYYRLMKKLDPSFED